MWWDNRYNYLLSHLVIDNAFCLYRSTHSNEPFICQKEPFQSHRSSSGSLFCLDVDCNCQSRWGLTVFYKDQSPTLVFLCCSPYIFGRIIWHFINSSTPPCFFTFSAYYFSKCSARGTVLQFKWQHETFVTLFCSRYSNNLVITISQYRQ